MSETDVVRGNADPSLRWTAITVRIAWELYRARMKPSRDLLMHARAHVLLSLRNLVAVAELEEAAGALVAEYLERAILGRYRGLQEPEHFLPPVTQAWRIAVEAACDEPSLAIFRLRFGDGMSLDAVSDVVGLDISSCQAVVKGLREVVREEAQARGHETPSSEPWADALLARVAGASGRDCPRPGLLWDLSRGGRGRTMDECREHAGACPRCARTVRLMKGGRLSLEDLDPPGDLPYKGDRTTILALRVHPQVRQHLKELAKALGRDARVLADDSILVPVCGDDSWAETLAKRARMGRPARAHLRGAMMTGPGQIAGKVFLGPLPVKALDASRARPWGEVDGILALPDPLPHPVSAAPWWGVALVAGLLAILAGVRALGPDERRPSFPMETSVHQGGGASIVHLDLDDRAILDVYSLGLDGIQPILQSAGPADKAVLATGEGSYEVISFSGGVLLVSSPRPLPGLLEAMCAGNRDDLEDRILALHPVADVRIFDEGER